MSQDALTFECMRPEVNPVSSRASRLYELPRHPSACPPAATGRTSTCGQSALLRTTVVGISKSTNSSSRSIRYAVRPGRNSSFRSGGLSRNSTLQAQRSGGGGGHSLSLDIEGRDSLSRDPGSFRPKTTSRSRLLQQTPLVDGGYKPRLFHQGLTPIYQYLPLFQY